MYNFFEKLRNVKDREGTGNLSETAEQQMSPQNPSRQNNSIKKRERVREKVRKTLHTM